MPQRSLDAAQLQLLHGLMYAIAERSSLDAGHEEHAPQSQAPGRSGRGRTWPRALLTPLLQVAVVPLDGGDLVVRRRDLRAEAGLGQARQQRAVRGQLRERPGQRARVGRRDQEPIDLMLDHVLRPADLARDHRAPAHEGLPDHP